MTFYWSNPADPTDPADHAIDLVPSCTWSWRPREKLLSDRSGTLITWSCNLEVFLGLIIFCCLFADQGQINSGIIACESSISFTSIMGPIEKHTLLLFRQQAQCIKDFLFWASYWQSMHENFQMCLQMKVIYRRNNNHPQIAGVSSCFCHSISRQVCQGSLMFIRNIKRSIKIQFTIRMESLSNCVPIYICRNLNNSYLK